MVTRRTSVRRYERGTLEFDRVMFLTDGIFAIAMTLLIVAVGIPILNGDTSRSHALLDAVGDKVPGLIAFAIGFWVIGSHWIAHHRFVSHLKAVDRRFVNQNLAYLGVIAFLPFPTGLMGEYFSNPVSVVVFALSASVVSVAEAVLFDRGRRSDLYTIPMSDEVYRWGLATSLLPVVTYAISMPLAFIASWVAVVVWGLSVPFQIWRARRAPDAASKFYA